MKTKLKEIENSILNVEYRSENNWYDCRSTTTTILTIELEGVVCADDIKICEETKTAETLEEYKKLKGLTDTDLLRIIDKGR